MELEHLKLESTSGAQINLDALYKICPACFTETRDKQTGKIKHVVNFETLRTLLGDDTVEDANEAYEFNWVGKQEARREVARPIKKTLRPVPEDSVDWDNTENLYIEGDNLEVLKLLQKSYLGKVKMIYIDPPYNTGNDFVYDDDFSQSQAEYDEAAGNVDELGNRFRKNTDTNGKFHSDWCSMIYSRLAVARSLLTEDGVIFISIDDKEEANIHNICNEIFGERNFVGNLVWQSRTSISNDDEISTNHNHTFVYSKNRDCLTFGGDDIDHSDYANPDNDLRGPWKLVPIDANHVGGDTQYPIRNPKTGTEYLPPNGRCWCYNPQVMNKLMKDGRIKFGLTDDSSPKRKLFLNERLEKGDKKTPSSLLLEVGTTKTGTTEIMKLFDGKKVFDYPKPTLLLDKLITYGFVKDNDIVLDFFSGSSTTAHAMMQYNARYATTNRYIMVQIAENLDDSLITAGINAKKTIQCAIEFLDSINKPHFLTELAKERIRRAGKKIKEELAVKKQQGGMFADQEEETKLDTGFRVLRLDESNMNEVYFTPKRYRQDQLDLFLNNVKNDRTDLDLLFGCMLDWGVQLSLPMAKETVDGCDIWTVNEGDVVACFSEKISQKVIDAIADKAPLRVIFRDSSFSADDAKINIYETFKQKLDWTDDEVFKNVKVI